MGPRVVVRRVRHFSNNTQGEETWVHAGLANFLYTVSSFSQLGNSAISVKGKCLPYVKIYVERKAFSNVKI